jgi:hypothetical protein
VAKDTENDSVIQTIQSMLDSHLGIHIAMAGLDGYIQLTSAKQIASYLKDPMQYETFSQSYVTVVLSHTCRAGDRKYLMRCGG